MVIIPYKGGPINMNTVLVEFEDHYLKSAPVNAAAASLSTNLAGDNNDLVYTANVKGKAGNDISVAYVVPTVASSPLSVSVTGNAITVSLATTASVAAIKATATTNLSGDNNDLIFTAKTAGADGNDISIEYVLATGNDAALDCSVTGTAITVTLGTDGSGLLDATKNTASLVKTKIEATTAADALVDVTLAAENTGEGAVTIMSALSLAGGADIDTDGILNDAANTGDLVKAAIEASPAASALVSVADKAANDGSGSVVAMAATKLTGGVDGTIWYKGNGICYLDASYIYVAYGTCTETESKFKKVALS